MTRGGKPGTSSFRGRVGQRVLLVGLLGSSPPATPIAPLPGAAILAEAVGRLPSAEQAFRQGRYDLAEARFVAVLDALPPADRATSASALLGLDGPGAYRRLVAATAANAALCRIRSRRPADALPLLEVALAADPDSASALEDRGIARLQLRQHALALADLERAWRLGRRSSRVRVLLGQAAVGAGRTEEADRWFAGVSAGADPESRGDAQEAARGRAGIAESRGELARARALLEGVLAEAPGDVAARAALVRVLARLGEEDAARAHEDPLRRDAAATAELQALLAASPGDVAGLHRVAATYADLGLPHLAAVHYRQLLARDPEDPLARAGLVAVTGGPK